MPPLLLFAGRRFGLDPDGPDKAPNSSRATARHGLSLILASSHRAVM